MRVRTDPVRSRKKGLFAWKNHRFPSRAPLSGKDQALNKGSGTRYVSMSVLVIPVPMEGWATASVRESALCNLGGETT